jgi:predicted nucleic acid-binding Zn ribbon protein
MSSRSISKKDRARWQVHRERFQLEEREPPAPYRVFTPEQVLPSVMKKMGLEQPLWEQMLVREWETLVGHQVARHTRPGRLNRNILHVFVANSVWLAELRRFAEKAMLDNLQQRFGRARIKGIRLQLDPDGTPAPRSRDPR